MSRKHYQAVADVIKDARPEDPTTREGVAEEATCNVIAEELAVVFKRDNSGFKRERFIAATQKDRS